MDLAIHLNPKIKRTTKTLYVGNLEFSTSEEKLDQAIIGESNLDVVQVENVTLAIPRVNGRSKYMMDSSSSHGHAVFR